jgi:hypothetical protein
MNHKTTIGTEETAALIDLAAARLALAESQRLRDDISEEEIALQAWFLKSTDDPEMRQQILSAGSLQKLAELRDTRAWGRWLKEQFDKADADARAAAEGEF